MLGGSEAKAKRFFGHWSVLSALGLPAAMAGTLLGVGIGKLLTSDWIVMKAPHWLFLDSPLPVQIVFGSLLYSWLPLVVVIIAAGLIGRWFPNWLAEWLARIRGYSLPVGLAWVLFCGASLLSPGIVVHIANSRWIKWPAILTWAGTTVASVLGGPKQQDQRRREHRGQWQRHLKSSHDSRPLCLYFWPDRTPFLRNRCLAQ